MFDLRQDLGYGIQKMRS